MNGGCCRGQWRVCDGLDDCSVTRKHSNSAAHSDEAAAPNTDSPRAAVSTVLLNRSPPHPADTLSEINCCCHVRPIFELSLKKEKNNFYVV